MHGIWQQAFIGLYSLPGLEGSLMRSLNYIKNIIRIDFNIIKCYIHFHKERGVNSWIYPTSRHG